MADEQKLKEALRRIAEAYWEERKGPILLSALPELLRADVGDYKDVLGNKSLKSFILSSSGEGAGYKLIAHATQSAKLGLLPVDASFDFPVEEVPRQMAVEVGQERTRERVIRSQEPVLTLLRALRALPAEELEKVVIPVSVLVKLLK